MFTVSVWILVVALVAFTGALGYMLIEGWVFLDALYMSVVTLTTTGFREVHPLSTAGMVWTMILSIGAIGLIFGTVGIVAERMVAEVASGQRGKRIMQRSIDALNNHFIVCGYGRVGSLVARELQSEGEQVVVLDVGEDSLARAEADGYRVVHGDGSSDAVLTRAGGGRAKGLVSCIDSDAQNVYVTITARALNPGLFIVGRAGDEAVVRKLRQAGADRAISPYTMAGRRIANLALRPRVVEFVEAALTRRDLPYTLEELSVTADGPLVGNSIGTLRAQGVFTLAIIPVAGGYEPNPGDQRVLAVGEHLIVSGSAEAVAVFE